GISRGGQERHGTQDHRWRIQPQSLCRLVRGLGTGIQSAHRRGSPHRRAEWRVLLRWPCGRARFFGHYGRCAAYPRRRARCAFRQPENGEHCRRGAMTALLDWLRRQVPASAHLCLDSRQVAPGDVFLACPGIAGDGRKHIDAALANGAAAVVLEERGLDAAVLARLRDMQAAVLPVSGLRAQLGELASEWYGRPSHRLSVIAVTGTNGKTSCTQWLAQALTDSGRPCGVIGTLGVRFADGSVLETGLTTPDVVTLHRALARMVQQGAAAVAIEASSIGLEQGR